jgi:hypothetical protein
MIVTITDKVTLARLQIKHSHMPRPSLRFGLPPRRAALAAVNQLCCLGRPSFASKHLRFLRPEHCPVLDSVLATTLGYRSSPECPCVYAWG